MTVSGMHRALFLTEIFIIVGFLHLQSSQIGKTKQFILMNETFVQMPTENVIFQALSLYL